MSSTTLYAAPAAGPMVRVADFRNAYGSAWYVWTRLSEKYYGDPGWFVPHGMKQGGETGGEFWLLADDPRLPGFELLTFLSTFDFHAVRRQDFLALADAYDAFVAAHPPGDPACSLPEQARLLRRLAGPEHSLAFLPGWVGWRQTSVAHNFWWLPGPGEDEGRLYDFGRDSGHTDAFADARQRRPDLFS